MFDTSVNLTLQRNGMTCNNIFKSLNTAKSRSFFFKERSDRNGFNPIQYGGGGALWPPYSFSLISPERLELRPSNFLTFSFYLLAIRKI